MTQELFETIEIGDTCKGKSFGDVLTGTIIIKDDDSVLMMVREGRRRMGFTTCAYERLELVERSSLSAIKEAITDMRPDLQKLMDLTA